MSQNQFVTETKSLAKERQNQSAYESYLKRNQHEEITSFTPTARKQFIIREEYVRRMSDLAQEGRSYISNMHFTGWSFPWSHNAEAAWNCQKADGISMFHLYPFLHYFLDFADPFKKVAVLVEEQETPWTDAEAVQEQDSLLTLAGWTVFRIPNAVAGAFETELVPPHLHRCPYGEFDDDEQAEDYQTWQQTHSTSRSTIDGFFGWLKHEFYLKD